MKAYSAYSAVAPKNLADHLQDAFDLKTKRPRDVLERSRAWGTLILRTTPAGKLFLNPDADVQIVSP